MKTALSLAMLVIVFASCQKDLSKKETVAAATVASDVLYPLPYHSTSFKSDYPIVPGEVPPFQFTKTLYPDTRVKTINMLSRVDPIYPGYKKQAVELNGTFTYATNTAYLKGTSEVWEYYKTAAGAAARKSISKNVVNWRFYFNDQGYCNQINYVNETPGAYWPELLGVYYPTGSANYIGGIYVYTRNPNAIGDYDSGVYYQPVADQYGNIVSFTTPADGYNKGKNSYVTYTYDYNIPRGSKNYSYIPSQNLISQEYSLLEVMQWIPQPTHQRKAVAGVFYLPNGSKITQSQTYNNYRFDAHGNEISVTYGDNIPQKTTWYPK